MVYIQETKSGCAFDEFSFKFQNRWTRRAAEAAKGTIIYSIYNI